MINVVNINQVKKGDTLVVNIEGREHRLFIQNIQFDCLNENDYRHLITLDGIEAGTVKIDCVQRKDKLTIDTVKKEIETKSFDYCHDCISAEEINNPKCLKCLDDLAKKGVKTHFTKDIPAPVKTAKDVVEFKEVPKDKTSAYRATINKMIRERATALAKTLNPAPNRETIVKTLWHNLYDMFENVTGINITDNADDLKFKNNLDYVEQVGLMSKLYEVADILYGLKED